MKNGNVLDIWIEKYGQLYCPVCGEGTVEKGRTMNMFLDFPQRIIACKKCWCLLSPLWAFPSIYENRI